MIIKEMLQEIVRASADGVRVGFDVQQVKIDRILQAYDRVKNDPNARIPSALMAAIEASR